MSPARGTYEFGSFSLDVDRRLLLKADQVVPLTSKVFDTLLVLIENRSRVVEKDELLKRIWPNTVVEERNLAVNISTLRKVLGENPESHEYIVTIPGRGYRFVAPLRELSVRPTHPRSAGPAATAPCDDSSGAASLDLPTANRPRRGLRPLLLAFCVLAGLIAAFSLGRYSHPVPARPGMRFSVVTNFAGVERQPAFSPDGRSVAFVSDLGGQYDIYVGLLSGAGLVRVTNDPKVEARPRWSPDGSKLLYAQLNESGLWDSWVVSALGGTARKLISNAADPVWSPDARLIAYANLTTGSIWMCDAAGREPRQLTSPEVAVRHRQPAFAPDGRSLAFVRRTVTGGPYAELALAQVGASQSRPLTDDAAYVSSPAWSLDGRFIYFASGRGGTINIWKVGALGGTPEQITVGQGDDADLDVAADGRRIVFSSYRTNINLKEIVLNGASAPPPKWLTSDARSERSPAYSRDGKRIAYFTGMKRWVGTNRRPDESEAVWVMEADGRNPVRLVEDARVNLDPRWSGDGQSLFYGSRPTGFWGQIELRQVKLSGGGPQTVPFAVGDHTGDVGPQDQLLYRGADGKTQIFDTKTNQVQTLKYVHGAYLRWCPDGRRFAAMVRPREHNDASAGVWIYDLSGGRQQVFRGWAAFYAWAGAHELLIAEGKPDLNATLWRVHLDGSPMVRAGSIRLIDSHWRDDFRSLFDVHPDGKRVVAEALELHQADLSMIENLP